MEQRMRARTSPRDFEEAVLPHLSAAYRLARWLTANNHDAEDVVQEAVLRAFRYFGSFRGGDSRAWLLTIVRNTCYTWLHRNRAPEPTTLFDEEIHSGARKISDPSTLLLRKADKQLIERALEELPLKFREILVLREVDALSYKEIAEVAGIPIGTVMSSLARARRRLQQSVVHLLTEASSSRLPKHAAVVGVSSGSPR
jgi:RNA polymerase sigma-70 factor, ECF subfamily